MKPNLFALATSELTQDTFLAWLLQWAAPEAAAHNESLARAACAFVHTLLALHGAPPAPVTSLKAGRQWENIDVWAEVNDSHLIIIEDKVGTGEHSNQLARYKATAAEWCARHGRELICVYIKTHSDSAANLQRVAAQGFAVLSRRDLLAFLETHSVASDIYNDFTSRLRQIETREAGFATRKIGEWTGDDWRGFYQLLESSRPLIGWGYVNNPSGGFWNAQLNWFEHDDYYPYMQIEQGRLCFKVGEVYQERAAVRHRYHSLLMEHRHTAPAGLERPSRFGNGTYMTVAVVPRQHWLGPDDSLLDAQAAITRLNQYEDWFRRIIAHTPPAAAPVCGLS